jgi:hypothetical protein
LKKDRLFVAFQGPIFQYVKREEERKAEAQMKEFRYPSSAELYALERWAHRERANAQARLLLSAFSAMKRLFRKMLAPSAKAVQKHVAHHA